MKCFFHLLAQISLFFDVLFQGTNLHVLDKKDVKVYVGGLPCDVTDLDEVNPDILLF